MQQLELEGIAEAILREGGQEDDEAPCLASLTRALLGPMSVRYTMCGLPGDGALICVDERWQIHVRRGLPTERLAFAIAHELAEWWFRVRERHLGSDIEDAANYVAAAILTPRRAFRTALSAHGSDFVRLAEDFHTTETHVALREAEIVSLPRAVVSPALVRVRGPEEWIWPSEATIRRWARGAVPGLHKVRLTDDPRRIVIDVETG